MSISVVIPILHASKRLEQLRHQLAAHDDIEVLLVLDAKNQTELNLVNNQERIFRSKKSGRGHALLEGFMQSQHDYVLFVHADTLLPNTWHEMILFTLRDIRVAGGCFSLTFDRQNLFLKSLIFFSNLLFYLTGELWGDRAIFFRRSALLGFEHIIDVPITEDIRLSQYLRKKGKLKLLKDKVQTSAEAFRRKGLLKHTFSILYCRWLYMVGVDPVEIYEIYYPRKKVKGQKEKGER